MTDRRNVSMNMKDLIGWPFVPIVLLSTRAVKTRGKSVECVGEIRLIVLRYVSTKLWLLCLHNAKAVDLPYTDDENNNNTNDIY